MAKSGNVLQQAQNEINQGRWQAAEKRLLAYLRRRSADPTAQHLLGLARMRAGRPAEAVPVLEQARVSRPQDARIATHLGVCRIRSGDHAGAYPVLKEAMKLDPEQGLAFLNAATAALNLEYLDVAQACAQRAHKLLPQETAPLLVLGQVAQKRQRLDEAQEHYRAALEIDPDSTQGREVLAGLLTRRGELEEAAKLYGKILEGGETFTRRFNYGSVQMELGNLAGADEQNRAAVELFLRGEDPERDPNPKEYMSVQKANQGLVAFKRAMDELGVRFFLMAGTLLGIVRDGEILPHDKDMDVGVPWATPRVKLLDALRPYDFVCPKEHKVRSGELGQWMFNVVHVPTGVNVDLFFARREGEIIEWGFDHPAGPMRWQWPRFGLQEWDFKGRTYLVPDPVEEHLEHEYGPEWRIPISNFDAVVSAYNRASECHELAVAYGFNRMLWHINAREWKKAAGYCDQLERITQDPVLGRIRDEAERRQAADSQASAESMETDTEADT